MYDKHLPVAGPVLAPRVMAREHPVVVGLDLGPEIGEVLRHHMQTMAGMVVCYLATHFTLEFLGFLACNTNLTNN